MTVDTSASAVGYHAQTFETTAAAFIAQRMESVGFAIARAGKVNSSEQMAYCIGKYRVTVAIGFVVIGLYPHTAMALDSTRRLTQALHRIWQVQQGLPEATIYCARQTDDGYLWLGTQTGLVRFDGVRFSSIAAVNGSLPEGVWVRDLLEDAEHYLWIATSGSGLFRLALSSSSQRAGVVTHMTAASGLPADSVQCLLLDRKNRVWIGTPGGLARWEHGTLVNLSRESKLTTGSIQAISQARDGAIWVAGEGDRVAVLSGGSWLDRKLQSLPPKAGVRALLGDSDGSIWIGATGGLVHLHDGRETLYTTKNGLGDNWVECLAGGSDGSVWVGTRDGFSRLRHEQIETFLRHRWPLAKHGLYALRRSRGKPLGWDQARAQSISRPPAHYAFHDERRAAQQQLRPGLPGQGRQHLGGDAGRGAEPI